MSRNITPSLKADAKVRTFHDTTKSFSNFLQKNAIERKKTKARKHGRTGWLLLAVILLAGSVTAAVLLNRKSEVSVPETEYPGGSLLARDAGEITSVTVTRRGQEPWTMTRDDEGNMRLDGADDWTVKDRITAVVGDAIANLVYADILTEDPAEYRDHLADFGLEDPYIVAQAHFSDGKDVTITGSYDGDLSGANHVSVSGDVNGSVDAGSSVTVEGSVGDHIEAGGNVQVGGSVDGGIDAGGRVNVGGNVDGDIEAGGNVQVDGDVTGSIEAERVNVKGDYHKTED